MEFSVRVVYHDDDGDEMPRTNEEVSIWVNDPGHLLPGEELFKETTDDDGRVSVDFETNHGFIYIKVYVGSMEGVDFTVDDEENDFTISYEYD